jgi:nicotinate-nucleotide adenylyltransferase
MALEATNANGERVGVLGGTFDPIHVAHLIIAEEARVMCHLDKVLFVPARVSPLKRRGGTLFTPEERYEMVRVATESQPCFEVSRIDLDRDGPSYTADTLRMLRESLPESTRLFFVMGMDSLVSLYRWRHPEEIIRLAHLIVISRPGYEPNMQALERHLPGIGASTEMLLSLDIGISSTELRRRIGAGLPIRYQVPEGVEAIVRARYPAVECPE